MTDTVQVPPPLTPPTAADEIAPRHLVPTPRQLRAGHARAAVTGARAWEAAEEPGTGRLARHLSALDLRRVRGPRRPILVFSLLALSGEAITISFVVIGPDLQATFAAAPAAIGLLSALIQVVRYGLMPFYGWLTDRVNRVALLFVTSAGGNVLFTLTAFADGMGSLAGGTALSGLLGLGAQTPQATLLADYYDDEDFGRLMALLPAVQTFASAVGPLALGLLIAATNWRVGLLALGCFGVACAFTVLLLREPPRGRVERQAVGTTPAPEPPPMSFLESWRAARGVRTLRFIWYATPFWVITSAVPTLFLVNTYFAQAYGMGNAERGVITTLVGLVGVAVLLGVTPLFGGLLERMPGRLMSLAATFQLLQVGATVLVALSPLLLLSVAATLPLALGIAVVPPLVQMVTLKVLPPRIRGLGFSTLAPWQLLGLLLFTIALTATQAAGARALVLTLIPFQVISAVFFARASGAVERDMRAARASVLAEEAVAAARAAGRAKLLVCRGVEAAYGGAQVLFGVDLDVEDGEMVALLGTNGAGKSTLLRAIAGTHTAANGAILVDGRDVTQEPAHANAARGVVLMPGGRATFPTLSVEENLRVAAWLCRGEHGEPERRIEEVLGHFPVLRDRLDRQAGNLSGGEQQMVGLGQALLMRPRLLMIDELTLGLAPAVVSQFLAVLREVHRRGTSVLLVEQSVNVALGIAERAVFMDKGEVRFDGPTTELLQRPDLLRSVYIGGAVAGRAAARRSAARGKPDGGSRGGDLEVQGVSVRYGGVEALRDASLTVGPAEIVGVIGPNGAGKTTLFDVVSGFATPSTGTVLLDGVDVTRSSPDARARRGLARSFQNVRLFPALTVRENIAVALERKASRNEAFSALWLPPVRRAEARIARQVEGLVELLGLEAFADKFLGELSTGSRRAAEVACIMAAEPRILLLDEPSSGLAQAETEALGPLLRRLVRETGCGLLVIEHDLPLVTAVADRLVAMDLGTVVTTGTPEEVLADARVVDSYMAASGASGQVEK